MQKKLQDSEDLKETRQKEIQELKVDLEKVCCTTSSKCAQSPHHATCYLPFEPILLYAIKNPHYQRARSLTHLVLRYAENPDELRDGREGGGGLHLSSGFLLGFA